MECWYEAVSMAPDGAELLLIDVDTVILRSLDAVWQQAFDIAYTTKPSRFPFNSGVVFVRVNDRSRAFVKTWRDENLRMLTSETHHQAWRRKYGGINQASLGYTLDSKLAAGVQLVQLPCVEWNCEDSSWALYDPSVTRILHVKSSLRRAVFLGHPAPVSVRPLGRLWRQLEQEALGPSSRSA
jgi:hypothetical protein